MLMVTNACSTMLDKRYVLEQRLGKGGMGSVYRAKHVHLRSTHAIKIISPEVVQADSSLRVRFTQEAILVASIQHPNIVSVTDFGVEVADTLYLVMEYIDGISLEEFLQQEGALSPARAFEVLRPISLGVGAAHKQGITHRDLKPLNVMLRRGAPLSQAVKVLDFGLAKIKSTETLSSLIMAKTTNLLGSPHYMPPEQWDNENVDTRSDIYSIGIMLFRMLTGDVPFKGNSMPNIMYQHMQAPVPSFESIDMPPLPAFEAVIRKALEKRQDARFQTVEEMVSAYERALFSTNERLQINSDAKTVSFQEDSFQRYETPMTRPWNASTDGKSYNLPYLDSAQNEQLSTFFNFPQDTGRGPGDSLRRDFIDAHGRVEAARTQVSQAEKLAQEFNEAQKAAESARLKLIEARQKLEEDIRQELQAEMDKKIAVERQAREQAEAEARSLALEAEARKRAEERANQLAKTALEAQQRAQEQREVAEREAQKRQLEEGGRRQAEQAASNLAHEAADALRRYEDAKRQADHEARCRAEAEAKRIRVEAEIDRIAAEEAERLRIAEEVAAVKIREQTSRLENEAIEAQKRADEARSLAESEVKKREDAEFARLRAEDEAKRLAEEIIAAQHRADEAEQRARFETEKRVIEEDARKRAEEAAHSLSEERRLISFGGGAASRPLIPLDAETHGTSVSVSSLHPVRHTIAGAGPQTDRIVISRSPRLSYLIAGILGLALLSGGGIVMYNYAFATPAPAPPLAGNLSENRDAEKPNTSELPARIGKKMVAIRGGAFMMGRNDAEPGDIRIYASQFPAHPVTVEDFFIDRTEVTNDEYALFVTAKGVKSPESWTNGSPPAGSGNMPVTGVSYFDAQLFADWISASAGTPCRLPTEIEWEYAARSGASDLVFPWGNEWVPERTNFATDSARAVGSNKDVTVVGGVHDMMGNVLEWTNSPFTYYPGFPVEKKEPVANLFSVRGVSYTKQGQAQLRKTNLLLTLRQGVSPDKKFPFLGFRISCIASMPN